jgi:hypothetical protein
MSGFILLSRSDSILTKYGNEIPKGLKTILITNLSFILHHEDENKHIDICVNFLNEFVGKGVEGIEGLNDIQIEQYLREGTYFDL